MLNIVSFSLVFGLAAGLAEFPDSIKRCRRGDEACYSRTSQDILKTYPNGLRGLNLLPFDPLQVSSMTLERNPNSPVNIDMKFKNMEVIGLNTAQVIEVKGLNLNERSHLEAFVPELLLKGNYTSNGQVLILTIRGMGKCVIASTNIRLKFSFDLKPLEKNGIIYALLEHEKLEFKPELVHYTFDGLFNGDKTLGDAMNKFLNENWREIYKEMENSFATALGLIVKQLMNNVFSKYPYDFLFSAAEQNVSQ